MVVCAVSWQGSNWGWEKSKRGPAETGGDSGSTYASEAAPHGSTEQCEGVKGFHGSGSSASEAEGCVGGPVPRREGLKCDLVTGHLGRHGMGGFDNYLSRRRTLATTATGSRKAGVVTLALRSTASPGHQGRRCGSARSRLRNEAARPDSSEESRVSGCRGAMPVLVDSSVAGDRRRMAGRRALSKARPWL